MHNQPLPPLKQQPSQPAKKAKKGGKDVPATAAVAAAAGSSDLLMWARQVSGDGALVKRWRLILRNLAFKVSSRDLWDQVEGNLMSRRSDRAFFPWAWCIIGD